MAHINIQVKLIDNSRTASPALGNGAPSRADAASLDATPSLTPSIPSRPMRSPGGPLTVRSSRIPDPFYVLSFSCCVAMDYITPVSFSPRSWVPRHFSVALPTRTHSKTPLPSSSRAAGARARGNCGSPAGQKTGGRIRPAVHRGQSLPRPVSTKRATSWASVHAINSRFSASSRPLLRACARRALAHEPMSAPIRSKE